VIVGERVGLPDPVLEPVPELLPVVVLVAVCVLVPVDNGVARAVGV